MKKLILASAIVAAFASHASYADEAAAPAAVPDHVMTFNVGVTTDYRYRGISQSRRGPALNGGADYTHSPTGLYAGTWASTINWINDTAVNNAPVEIDLYAGKRGELGGGLTYDVGGLYYYYPNNDLPTNANTFELYGQVGFGPAYLKYSHALTDTFGNADSKNSYYVDAGVNQELTDGYVLNLHVGYQKLKNTIGSYTDWKLGVTKDFGFVTGSIAYIGTNADEGFYTLKNKFNGSDTVVVSVVKNF